VSVAVAVNVGVDGVKLGQRVRVGNSVMVGVGEEVATEVGVVVEITRPPRLDARLAANNPTQ